MKNENKSFQPCLYTISREAMQNITRLRAGNLRNKLKIKN